MCECAQPVEERAFILNTEGQYLIFLAIDKK